MIEYDFPHSTFLPLNNNKKRINKNWKRYIRRESRKTEHRVWYSPSYAFQALPPSAPMIGWNCCTEQQRQQQWEAAGVCNIRSSSGNSSSSNHGGNSRDGVGPARGRGPPGQHHRRYQWVQWMIQWCVTWGGITALTGGKKGFELSQKGVRTVKRWFEFCPKRDSNSVKIGYEFCQKRDSNSVEKGFEFCQKRIRTLSKKEWNSVTLNK